MRRLSITASVLAALVLASCGGGSDGITPSEQDIRNALEEQLRSVAGDWTGFSTGTNPIRLEFRLQEGGGGQITGTGTMKEDSAPAAVPIVITGSFQRPMLTLNIDGMVVDGRQVKGFAQGSYTTVGGIGTTLKLTGTDYSRDVQILLQEK